MNTNDSSAKYENGIDVSHYQGEIDWVKVKASNIHYAMAKATEGGDFQDNMFLKNWVGMKKNCIKAGAYHYFRALSSTPIQQMENIIGVLNKVGFSTESDCISINVEEKHNEGATPTQMADNLFLLISALKYHFLKDKWPYIYCSPNFWEKKVDWKKYDFSKCPLWIAHWDVPSPKVPETWKNKGWLWWHYTNKGKVDGISGDVDRNYICINNETGS